MTPFHSWAMVALLFVLAGLLVCIVAELEARAAGRQRRNRSAGIPAKPAPNGEPVIGSVHDIAKAHVCRTTLARPEDDDDLTKSRCGELCDHAVDGL